MAKKTEAFHTMMDFIKECKCSNAMLHAPTIFCEIVEQMWASARYDSGTKTLSVMINNVSYNINGDTVGLLLDSLGILLIECLLIMRLLVCLEICIIMATCLT